MKQLMQFGKRWIVLGNNEDDKNVACLTDETETVMFSDSLIDFGNKHTHSQTIEFTEDVDNTDINPDEYPYWDNDNETGWKYVAIGDDGSPWFEKRWEVAKPLEKNESLDYNKSIGETNMANVNTTLDVGSLMNMKMVEKLLEKDDFEIKDLMEYQMKSSVMQGLTNGQGIDINDVIRQKIVAKYMLDDSKEDMNFTQLAVLNMLQNGRIDINQLMMIKVLEKLDK